MARINVEAVPAELRADPHWVVWRWVEREGKRTKPPFNPRTDRPGDATDPKVWMTFEDALKLAKRFDGLGFAVTADSPYAGIDLDQCISEDGALAEWALEIVNELASYTEITPSGRGVRIWVRGKLPPGRRRKGHIEMYDAGRYFTVTGAHLDATPRAIAERAEALGRIHSRIFANGTEEPKAKAKPVLPLTDQDILDRMYASRNGHKISNLMEGDASGFNSASEADLALCSHLAWWFGGDVDAIDRLFRQSARYRLKWDRADYREKTIQKALEQKSFYDPQKHAPPRANGRADGNGQPTASDEPLRRSAEDDPHRLANVFLWAHYAHPEHRRLVYWGEQWYCWGGHIWETLPEKDLAASVTSELKAEFERLATTSGEVPRRVTTHCLGNVMQALRAECVIPMLSCRNMPAWIGATEAGEDLPDPKEILAASNCLVHLPSLMAGQECKLALTPRFFSVNSLGYRFDSDGEGPRLWLEFLAALWGDDRESIECLQEWFGYLLMPDTAQQKILMLIGPKRSGKGTVARVLKAVVGERNVAAPTFSSLASDFGLAPLIGHPVAIVTDARLSGRADTAVIVERLLSISGEDLQTIDRKYLSHWTGTLPTRFVLLSNELPRLGDASGALASRMILLQLKKSFYDEEDKSLTERLLRELPGILMWSIEGLARLRNRGRFTRPKASELLIEELERLSSPISTFIEERCELASENSICCQDLYNAWRDYCKESGKDKPGDLQGFSKNLHAAVPEIETSQVKRDGTKHREFKGIALCANYRF